MSKKELAGVTVCVRIRPQNAAEREAEMAVVMRPEVSECFQNIAVWLLRMILWCMLNRKVDKYARKWM